MNFLDFFEGKGTDDKGRYLSDILTYDDSKLESSHDIVQRIFPLKEKSEAQPNSPVITDEEIKSINESEDTSVMILSCFFRFIVFYGFTVKFKADETLIERAHNWEERKKVWLRPRNHNFLRMTRILISMQLFEKRSLSKALFDALEKVYEESPEIIGETTFEYWKEAMEYDSGQFS